MQDKVSVRRECVVKCVCENIRGRDRKERERVLEEEMGEGKISLEKERENKCGEREKDNK